MTAPSLSLTGPTGSVRYPRAWVRRLLELDDAEAALVGLCVPALVHPEGAVAGTEGEPERPETVRLDPGECLVSVRALANLIGRRHYPNMTERAVRTLAAAEFLTLRDLSGDAIEERDPARRLVIGVKGWGDYQRPY